MDELDKEILEAPYRRMKSLEDKSEQDYLLKVYENSYQAKYKTRYIPALGHVDRTIIADIKRMIPDKAAQVIEHYFKLNDKYFVEMRHSLEVLKRNLNKVFSELERQEHRPKFANVGLWTWEVCDKCRKSFKAKLDTSVDIQTICEQCLKN